MKQGLQTLYSPYLGLLQLEVIQLMKEGWAVYKPIKLKWSWLKMCYIFKIVLQKVDGPVNTDKMIAELTKHIDELSTYNQSKLGIYLG